MIFMLPLPKEMKNSHAFNFIVKNALVYYLVILLRIVLRSRSSYGQVLSLR